MPDDYPKIPESALETEAGFRTAVLMQLEFIVGQQGKARVSRAEIHARIDKLQKRVLILTSILTTVIVGLAKGGEHIIPLLIKLLGGGG